MPEPAADDGLVVAHWTCEVCARSGVATGRREPGRPAPADPVPANCYFCQATIMLRLADGLSPQGLRVEGEHAVPRQTRCPACGGGVKGYWDERGAPLVLCVEFGHPARLAVPGADTEA